MGSAYHFQQPYNPETLRIESWIEELRRIVYLQHIIMARTITKPGYSAPAHVLTEKPLPETDLPHTSNASEQTWLPLSHLFPHQA